MIPSTTRMQDPPFSRRVYDSSSSLVSPTSFNVYERNSLLVYTHMSDATSIAFAATSSALISSTLIKALAAASANGLPLPIDMTPSVISKTSPFPVISNDLFSSATISEASSLRKYLSVLHPLASSTHDRESCPGYSSSFPSNRSSRVKASAVAPAKPTSVAFCSSFFSDSTVPPSPPLGKSRWILTAFGLTIMLPMLTIPSPIMQTLPFFRTHKIVVPW
mmetsp:Transcript_5443/g.11229  ORF Transcript_5443/g.11229 Transcript_5443/m.11229 type:complete len:220 (-) Transcript_5443:337-996(-)